MTKDAALNATHKVTTKGTGYAHEGDCVGSYCPTCGCCLHCLDVGCGCNLGGRKRNCKPPCTCGPQPKAKP